VEKGKGAQKQAAKGDQKNKVIKFFFRFAERGEKNKNSSRQAVKKGRKKEQKEIKKYYQNKTAPALRGEKKGKNKKGRKKSNTKNDSETTTKNKITFAVQV
jgi:hypothetical protein